MIFPTVIILMIAVTVAHKVQRSSSANEITFTDLLSQIEGGHVHDVTISGNEIAGHFEDNRAFATYAPGASDLVSKLETKKVQVSARPAGDVSGILMTLFINVLPFIPLGLWVYMSRQMQGGGTGVMGGRAMGFGKSKAKLLTESQGRVTFEDVAGVDEAKEDLEEIVEFLRDPQKFQRLGGR
ncbi:MAG TPA: ATP-dependent metallopeptidase FtsH/Yme1/Tma family protein, partial [Methylocella sp.]